MPPDSSLRFASWLRRRGYARGLASLLAALKPGGEERILDLGAGTGVIASEVALHSTSVYAIDPQERRVAYIRETCPTVSASVGRAEKIPSSDGYFDKVYIVNAFHHFGVVEPALREIRRVLKPGGLLVIQDSEPGRAGARVERMLSGRWVTFRGTEEMAELLGRSGFQIRGSEIYGGRYTLAFVKSPAEPHMDG